MSASNELGQWYRSIPKITRAWFTSSIVVSLAARLGIVRPHSLVLFVNPIIKQFQVGFSIDFHREFSSDFSSRFGV